MSTATLLNLSGSIGSTIHHTSFSGWFHLSFVIYGKALYYLVGLQPLLIASWMSWSLRLPHLIEILCDEFVYAGALAWLLGAGETRKETSHESRNQAPAQP